MMASCTTIQEYLEGYLQGRLSPEHTRCLEDHLHQCVDCRQALVLEQLLLEGIRTYPVLDPPPDLAEAVLDRLAPSSLMVGLRATISTMTRGVLRHTQRLIAQRITFARDIVRARWTFAHGVLDTTCTELKSAFIHVSTLT